MNLKNIKLPNKGLLLLFAYAFLFSIGLHADEFGDALNTVTGASNSGKGVLGEGMRWTFAVFLPIVCMVSAGYLGYTQAKKKAEQEQASFKIYAITAMAGLIGFFVFCIIGMLLSSALFGDSKMVFDIIHQFWRGV
ncbi:hypothetical protein FDW47_08275 [Campylobacter helveticus]|uniref:hypothetical protein n=1 Tax=Campylobacter helveticus TaxID=28898 RepID=UPI0011120260|nr:hypothetical protein [Campylobacter helveticus]TNB54321.1 hypothetical protein FDW47_08275 [Campylobacter helveticus]